LDDSPNHPAVHSLDYTLLIVGWCSHEKMASSWDIYPLLLVLLSLRISFLLDTLFFVGQSFPFCHYNPLTLLLLFTSMSLQIGGIIRDQIRKIAEDEIESRTGSVLEDWMVNYTVLRQSLINQEFMC
jgi:hypothetical protein